jgi:hypothetical protein
MLQKPYEMPYLYGGKTSLPDAQCEDQFQCPCDFGGGGIENCNGYTNDEYCVDVDGDECEGWYDALLVGVGVGVIVGIWAT